MSDDKRTPDDDKRTPDDDELRRMLADAHHDDAPPPFAAILGRARHTRRWPFALALPLAAAAIALVILLMRPKAPPSLAVEMRDPLAFLLEPPAGDDLLRSVPQFDTGQLDIGGNLP